MWKKLSTKVILDHPRLKVVEDEVELPNGKRTDYLRFERGGNAPTVIAVNNEGKILVIKEYFYVVDEWFYLFPGGFVPDAEDVKEGMCRELEEETGFRARSLREIGYFYPNIRRTPMKVAVFIAEDLEKTQTKWDEEEDIKVYWLSEEEVEQLIAENKFKVAASLAAWAVFKANK